MLCSSSADVVATALAEAGAAVRQRPARGAADGRRGRSWEHRRRAQPAAKIGPDVGAAGLVRTARHAPGATVARSIPRRSAAEWLRNIGSYLGHRLGESRRPYGTPMVEDDSP